MTQSIELEAMIAFAETQRDTLVRIANVRRPDPPNNLKTHDERVAFRQGVEAMFDEITHAKKDR